MSYFSVTMLAQAAFAQIYPRCGFSCLLLAAQIGHASRFAVRIGDIQVTQLRQNIELAMMLLMVALAVILAYTVFETCLVGRFIANVKKGKDNGVGEVLLVEDSAPRLAHHTHRSQTLCQCVQPELKRQAREGWWRQEGLSPWQKTQRNLITAHMHAQSWRRGYHQPRPKSSIFAKILPNLCGGSFRRPILSQRRSCGGCEGACADRESDAEGVCLIKHHQWVGPLKLQPCVRNSGPRLYFFLPESILKLGDKRLRCIIWDLRTRTKRCGTPPLHSGKGERIQEGKRNRNQHWQNLWQRKNSASWLNVRWIPPSLPMLRTVPWANGHQMTSSQSKKACRNPRLLIGKNDFGWCHRTRVAFAEGYWHPSCCHHKGCLIGRPLPWVSVCGIQCGAEWRLLCLEMSRRHDAGRIS